MLQKIHSAKIVNDEKESFFTSIILYNEKDEEIARSDKSHPQGSFKWRYYIDEAKLTYIDFFSPYMQEGTTIFVTFNSIKDKL